MTWPPVSSGTGWVQPFSTHHWPHHTKADRVSQYTELHLKLPPSLSLPCSYVQSAAQLLLISQLLRNLFFNHRFLFVPLLCSFPFCPLLFGNCCLFLTSSDLTLHLDFHFSLVWSQRICFDQQQKANIWEEAGLKWNSMQLRQHLSPGLHPPSLFNSICPFRYFDTNCAAAKMHVMAQTTTLLSPFN